MTHFTAQSNHLEASFTFKDFKTAFAFLQLVAFESEAMNHHPEIHNVYNKVTIKLSTHDAGNTITPKDHDLANKIEKVFGLFS